MTDEKFCTLLLYFGLSSQLSKIMLINFSLIDVVNIIKTNQKKISENFTKISEELFFS